MKRLILFLSAVTIILTMAVSCSKEEVNKNALPLVGNADLNGQQMELTYSLLGKLNTYPLPGGIFAPPRYAFMLAGEMDAYGNLIREPYLFGFIDTFPEAGSEVTFDLDKKDLSLCCILRNNEYLQNPKDKAIPIVSGKLRLQRSANDIFHLEFDIRTKDGNIFSGTAKLNYIP